MYDRLLNTREVAQRLNVSRSYVYHLIKEGELPFIRIRHSIRVHPQELDRYMEDRMRRFRMVMGDRSPHA